MKVLFLDFDGVLNNHHFLYNMEDRGDRRLDENDELMIDTNAVQRLNKVVAETGAKVVVSSSWRFGRTVGRLAEILKLRGFTGEVIGMTPFSSWGRRGSEIQLWMDQNPGVTHFVIVDDDSDMDHLMDKLVKTTFEKGLMDEHVPEILRHLQ